MGQAQKQKILIADDSEMNRSILTDMLGEEYDILEAKDGLEAVALLQKHSMDISVVLLDIVMPHMDGFGVLAAMNHHHWIEDVPVIMISTETGSSHIDRAFELGVTDFINRPFDARIVYRRVVNTILLYAKQKKLINLVADEIYEKEHRSSLMIDILSHIVEFRNGESGMHVIHVRLLTELLLKRLIQKTDRYALSPADISMIGMASALHDIGKISIPEEVLNKPGKLTNEEFAIMKRHSSIGAEMLSALPFHQNEPLLRSAYEICRWHHERYDGRGYPDGLVGDAIPISAQIVALADVYDALTSVRVYKPPIPHDEAVHMILNGQCGTFNPLLLECLQDISETLPDDMNSSAGAAEQVNQLEMRTIVEEMQQHEELTASKRTLQLLEHERMKYDFFAALTEEVQFEYTPRPSMLTLNAWGAEKLNLSELTMDPLENETVKQIMRFEDIQALADLLHSTAPSHPDVSYDYEIHLPDGPRWYRIIARAMWSSDEPPRYTGAIGKALDRTNMRNLEQQASHDALTGLLNHSYAKRQIQERLKESNGYFALAMLDLDHFKSANDTYGHMFGDEVLKHLADRLRNGIRSGDIVARVGGDEFLIFLEFKNDVENLMDRIYDGLAGGSYKNFTISISMGVATTQEVGTEYGDLFHAADQALYFVKENGRGSFRFYDSSMDNPLSNISSIDE